MGHFAQDLPSLISYDIIVIVCLNPVVFLSNVFLFVVSFVYLNKFFSEACVPDIIALISITNHHREPKWLLNHKAPGQQWENPVFT